MYLCGASSRLPILTVCNIFMLPFVSLLVLEMTSERSKHRDFLALTFITKKKTQVGSYLYFVAEVSPRGLVVIVTALTKFSMLYNSARMLGHSNDSYWLQLGCRN